MDEEEIDAAQAAALLASLASPPPERIAPYPSAVWRGPRGPLAEGFDSDSERSSVRSGRTHFTARGRVLPAEFTDPWWAGDDALEAGRGAADEGGDGLAPLRRGWRNRAVMPERLATAWVPLRRRPFSFGAAVVTVMRHVASAEQQGRQLAGMIQEVRVMSAVLNAMLGRLRGQPSEAALRRAQPPAAIAAGLAGRSPAVKGAVARGAAATLDSASSASAPQTFTALLNRAAGVRAAARASGGVAPRTPQRTLEAVAAALAASADGRVSSNVIARSLVAGAPAATAAAAAANAAAAESEAGDDHGFSADLLAELAATADATDLPLLPDAQGALSAVLRHTVAPLLALHALAASPRSLRADASPAAHHLTFRPSLFAPLQAGVEPPSALTVGAGTAPQKRRGYGARRRALAVQEARKQLDVVDSVARWLQTVDEPAASAEPSTSTFSVAQQGVAPRPAAGQSAGARARTTTFSRLSRILSRSGGAGPSAHPLEPPPEAEPEAEAVEPAGPRPAAPRGAQSRVSTAGSHGTTATVRATGGFGGGL
jgi:hypothetical protein